MDTSRILWIAMTGSLVMFFGLTLLVPPGASQNPLLNILLPLVGIADLGLSFVLPKLMRPKRPPGPPSDRQMLLVSLAICESVALMGLVLHLTTGWSYSWTMFLLAGLGMLLHFPRALEQ